jgi:hypothetical protein
MANRQQNIEAEFVAEQPYDSSDVDQVTDKRKKVGRAEKERREDLESLMRTVKGRKFLWDFCAAFLVVDPYVPQDHAGMAYMLGQTVNSKRYYLELLKVNPQLAATMVEENLGK